MPWTYAWSSVLAHTGGSEANGLLDMEYWAKEWSPAKWKKVLRAGDAPEEAKRLRRHTSRGRPLASDRLLARLEHKLGRRLRPLPVGRP